MILGACLSIVGALKDLMHRRRPPPRGRSSETQGRRSRALGRLCLWCCLLVAWVVVQEVK